MDRRKFIETSGAAAGAAILSGVPSSANPVETAKPQQKAQKPSKIKLGLYSISYGGIWYQGSAVSFEEFCKLAKQFKFEGIELDNKRPMGSPLDLNEKKRDEMRNIMAKYGLEIPCVAANNDFSSPIPEHREMQLLMVRETAKLAKDLGAGIVRLFAAWAGVPIHEGVGTYDFGAGESFYNFERQYPYVTWIERYNFVKDCLKEAAKIGEEYGVVMTLQNHHPLIRTWRDTFDLVKEVNSPYLKVCLDLPIFDKQDKEYIADAVRTIGSLQVHSHFGGEYYRDANNVIQPKLLDYYAGGIMPDYSHYIQLMREIGYNGYFTFELCHPLWNKDHTRAGIEFVHEQVELAHDYMAAIVAK